jgi:hypothetical protein
VFDCDLDCVESSLLSYLGDSFCDSSIPIDLNCEEFDFDDGDCLDPEPEPDPEPGVSCGDGRVYDCSLICVSESLATSWTGDGFCEDGTTYEGAYNLYCEAFDMDGGDCDESDDTGADADADAGADADTGETPGAPVPGAACGTDRVYDCAGECVVASTAEMWSTDMYCDGEEAVFGMHLDCEAFDFDDGACEETEDDTGLFVAP